MKKAFTLIELIFVILIMGIISTFLLTSIVNYYKKFDQNNRFSQLNNESRMASEQIKRLLENRLSFSMIGYNPYTDTYKSLFSANENYQIFEWMSYSYECLDRKSYYQFLDLNSSSKLDVSLHSPLLNNIALENCLTTKWGSLDVAVSFSGLFDEGEMKDDSLYPTYFGWHGSTIHNLLFSVNRFESEKIFLNEIPNTIYERFYLIDSAYALARGQDINMNSQCIRDFNLFSLDENSLFLFYNYQPWTGETFCADPNGTGAGNVTLLMPNVFGFNIYLSNGSPVVFINSRDDDVIVTKERKTL